MNSIQQIPDDVKKEMDVDLSPGLRYHFPLGTTLKYILPTPFFPSPGLSSPRGPGLRTKPGAVKYIS